MEKSDIKLLKEYMRGFDDELWSKGRTPTDESLMRSAYLLGCDHAIIGDDVSSIDDLTEEEVLKLIKNG